MGYLNVIQGTPKQQGRILRLENTGEQEGCDRTPERNGGQGDREKVGKAVGGNKTTAHSFPFPACCLQGQCSCSKRQEPEKPGFSAFSYHPRVAKIQSHQRHRACSFNFPFILGHKRTERDSPQTLWPTRTVTVYPLPSHVISLVLKNFVCKPRRLY